MQHARLADDPRRALLAALSGDATGIAVATSGSTGTPKGVAVSHRSAAAFVDAEAQLFLSHEPAGVTDRVLAGLSVAFDASCEEMWLAWRNGACLVPAPRSLVRTGMDLGPWLITNGITIVSTVPTLAGLWPVESLEAVRLLIFGGAVVAAAFALAWAAEAAEVDISGGLAVAILAVIAVLPEYAVDLYFAYRAGSEPDYIQYAAANMTGSNRLLLGLGWPVVVLLSVFLASRRSGRTVKEVLLEREHRLELGFLLVASVLAFVMPLTGTISWILGCILLGWFIFYLIRVAQGEHDEAPELVGPAARIGALPARQRRPIVVIMFIGAAGVILACAEPFAEALVATGSVLGSCWCNGWPPWPPRRRNSSSRSSSPSAARRQPRWACSSRPRSTSGPC